MVDKVDKAMQHFKVQLQAQQNTTISVFFYYKYLFICAA